MKLSLTILGLWIVCAAVQADLVLVPEETPATIFAGQPAAIRVVLRNTGDTAVETNLSTRLYQVASTVRMPVGDAQPWKTVQVLPHQTVLESFPLTVPAVNGPTRFQVAWAGLGHTEIAAYPAEWLKQLAALAGPHPVAVFDPGAKLRPVLKKMDVEFTDFEIAPGEARLALVWSERPLPESIVTRAKKGMAVVWVRPQKLPACGLRLAAGTVLIVPAAELAGLADSPAAQVQLLRYAEWALQSENWEKLLTERN